MSRARLAFSLTISTILVACAGPQAPEWRIREGSAAVGASDGAALARGQMLLARGEPALAIEAFRKAIRYAPEDPASYAGLAAGYERLGRYDLSSRYYQLALARAPRNPALLAGLTRSLEPQASGTDPRPVQLGRSAGAEESRFVPARGPTVSIDLDPVAPTARAGKAPDEGARVQLERLSFAEVSLVTRARSAPASASAAIGPRVRIDLDAPRRTSTAGTEVRIMNAVGRRGQAGRMRAYLTRLGWSQIATGDAPARATQSRLIVPAGHREEALRLAQHLPFRAPIVSSRSGGHIVLLLGTNAVRFDDGLMGARN